MIEPINPIEELMKFQEARGLDKQPFDIDNELTNILEELGEMLGAQDINRENLRALTNAVSRYFSKTTNVKQPTDDDRVDALADVVVFCVGAMMKLGYNPDKVLYEVSKEINSRTGLIIDGKFVKYKSEEAMKLWYKADLASCKIDKGED